jgi:hypothetical protein
MFLIVLSVIYVLMTHPHTSYIKITGVQQWWYEPKSASGTYWNRERVSQKKKGETDNGNIEYSSIHITSNK